MTMCQPTRSTSKPCECCKPITCTTVLASQLSGATCHAMKAKITVSV